MRLDADLAISNKISDIKRYVRDNHDLSFDRSGIMPILEFNHKQIQFFYQTDVMPVAGADDLYVLDVRLTWEESGAKRHLSRMSMLELG